jgi:hypothetical protein
VSFVPPIGNNNYRIYLIIQLIQLKVNLLIRFAVTRSGTQIKLLQLSLPVCYTTVKEHAGDLPANVHVPFGTDLVNNLEQAEALLESKIIG